MARPFCDRLYKQCLQRTRARLASLGQPATPDVIATFARRVAQIARQNTDRIPLNVRPNPRTSFPDSYIDDIIVSLIKEGPRVAALLAKDNAAWEQMLNYIHRRARSNLARYYEYLPIKVPLNSLARDMALHCAAILLRRLPTFPFDTSLDAWVAVLVANEVRTLRHRADFRWNDLARSLDAENDSQLDSPRLMDTLADEGLDDMWRQWEEMFVVTSHLDDLTPDQREVIWRGLNGEDSDSIARHMNRTRDAVYSLRARAVKVLRERIAAD